jgi:hypothetical protein
MRILGISGKKGSGKNTLSNFLHGFQLRANNLVEDFSMDEGGKLHVTYEGGKSGLLDVERQDPQFAIWASAGMWPYVKSYAFAHPLKEMCINLFGIPRECLYGTDEQKNTVMEHLLWENMPGVLPIFKDVEYDEVYGNLCAYGLEERVVFHEPGPMTAREFMQFLGTEVMRKIYAPLWTNRCLSLINDEESALAIITDVRFDNEAEAILGAGGKVIKLTRGITGDGHDSEKGISPHLISNVLDNANLDLVDTCQNLLQIIESYGWQD